MPLNLLVTCPFIEPAADFGGPTEVIRQLTPHLVEQGLQVSLVGTDLGIPKELPRDCWVERPGGYRAYYSTAGKLTPHAPHYAPRAAPGILAALAAPGPTVVHLNLGFTHLGLLASRLARRHSIPYVLTPHGVYGRHNMAARSLAKRLFLALFERRVIRGAAFIQALVKAEADAIRSIGGTEEQVQIIPNGVSLSAFDQRHPTTPLSKLCGFSPDRPFLLSLSRIHSSKGLDLLIPAFAEATRERADWQLVIAGPDDGYLAEARQLAEQAGVANGVHFPGPLFGDAKQQAFADARAFALTSYAEGMPLAVLEACAAGLPVLISDHCNLPDIESAGAGFVCPTDHAGTAAGLRRLIDAEDRDEMGRLARRLAEDNYTWGSIAQRLCKLYEQATATS